MDWRFSIALMLNQIFFLFFTPQATPVPWVPAATNLLHHPILKLAFSFFVVSLLLFSLFTLPIQVHLSDSHFHLRTENFSVSLATAYLASFFIPPPRFFPAYLLLLLVSPWHRKLAHISANFLLWFAGTLQTLSRYLLAAIQNEDDPQPAVVQNQGTIPLPPPPPPPPHVEVDIVEIVRDSTQSQPNVARDCVIAIDGGSF